MSKALEAARRAIEAHPAYDCGSTGDEEMALAAVTAYLTHLAEDEAVVERIGLTIETTAHIISEGGEDDGISNLDEVSLAVLKSLAGKE